MLLLTIIVSSTKLPLNPRERLTMTQKMPMEKHTSCVRRVAKLLRQKGLTVAIQDPRDGYDLLVNACVRVCIRVSIATRLNHSVTVCGRKYQYLYWVFGFNFHRRGQIIDKCDFFVCWGEKQGKQYVSFVIPRAAITGPTFILHVGKRPYRGNYRQFLDNWEGIGTAAAM